MKMQTLLSRLMVVGTMITSTTLYPVWADVDGIENLSQSVSNIFKERAQRPSSERVFPSRNDEILMNLAIFNLSLNIIYLSNWPRNLDVFFVVSFF